jgi:hypothetical protein
MVGSAKHLEAGDEAAESTHPTFATIVIKKALGVSQPAGNTLIATESGIFRAIETGQEYARRFATHMRS